MAALVCHNREFGYGSRVVYNCMACTATEVVDGRGAMSAVGRRRGEVNETRAAGHSRREVDGTRAAEHNGGVPDDVRAVECMGAVKPGGSQSKEEKECTRVDRFPRRLTAMQPRAASTKLTDPPSSLHV